MKLELLPGKPDLSFVAQIPWMELDHAYGSAIDVPGQIEALLSPDEEVRRNVRFGFSSNLFHQGSVYPATVAAIPVFQHLLRYQQVPDRSEILAILANFAVGGADDSYENIELPELIDEIEEQSSNEDWAPRECYLGVAAGVPLYESLLFDPDPRVVSAAAFTLAFFPAHAFASCPALLSVAGDEGRHDYERSSSLLALSYLHGGSVRDAFLQTLSQLVESERANGDRPVTFLAASAAYCLVREKSSVVGKELRAAGEKLAARSMEHGLLEPPCDFYADKPAEFSDDRAKIDVRDLLISGPRFPWGDLGVRIRRHVDNGSPIDVGQRVSAIMRKGAPDPDAFNVRPNAIDRENVIAAARRLHASLWGMPLPRAAAEFEPFKAHAMFAWDEMLRLLDSDVPEDRWAAARVIEHFGPLPEAAVDQLIERLQRGDNSNLGRLILNQPVSHRQCEELCLRLCRREYEVSQYHAPRDDYRQIILKHGTTDQLRRLLADGEFKERFAAAQVLCSRGECDPQAALPIFTEGLLSADYGTTITAKMMFAQWNVAHRWFLESYETIPETQRWAIAEAMSVFKADLTGRQDDLMTRIETERNQVLAARLVRVLGCLQSPQDATLDRLMGLFRGASAVLLRGAIARTLGQWMGRQADQDAVLIGHLQHFLTYPSPRIRWAAVDALAGCDDRPVTIAALRRLLVDDDVDLRRHALWHLRFRGALTAEDLDSLLSPSQPDRVASETLLAASTTPLARELCAKLAETLVGEDRPMTRSVWGWMTGQKNSR